MQVKKHARPRQRERRAARRTAFHAERIERAASAADRLHATVEYLVSAVAHSPQPARTARALTSTIAEHARRFMDNVNMTGSSRALHEAKLTAGGTEVARLASALMVLRSVIERLPEDEADQMRTHYTSELAAEAARIPRR